MFIEYKVINTPKDVEAEMTITTEWRGVRETMYECRPLKETVEHTVKRLFDYYSGCIEIRVYFNDMLEEVYHPPTEPFDKSLNNLSEITNMLGAIKSEIKNNQQEELAAELNHIWDGISGAEFHMQEIYNELKKLNT